MIWHQVVALVRELLSGELDTKFIEKRYFKKGGGIVWTHVRTALHRDSEGEPLYFLTNIIDITERKHSEDLNARFESIFNATKDLVSFVDADYVYRAVNEQYLRYWRTTREAIVGKFVSDLISDEAYKSIVRPNLDVCMMGQEVHYQSWFDFPGAGHRFMDVSYNPVRLADGIVAGVAVSVRDISALKKQEDQLTNALVQLKTTNAELEQFAYAASHDLQEPLNTIANFTGLLQSNYAHQLDETGIEFLQLTHDGAIRMKSLIEALLHYSRLRQATLHYELVDCEQMIEDLVHDLQDLVTRTNADIKYQTCTEMVADVALLRQLMQNLLTNAIKFRRPDTRPQIEIAAIEEPDRWLVTVQDNGIGIEEKNFEEIFGIFRRLHTRDEYVGTGLGLALCKQIVTLHGGEIWLTSEAGVGSTFYFTLPKREL